MPVTLMTTPTYARPGRIRVSAALTVGDYWRIWLTSAPPGSKLAAELGASERLEVFSGAAADEWVADLDVGGVYTFKARAYTLLAQSYGGGYQSDPDSALAETPAEAEGTAAVYIGQRLELPITLGANAARLAVWVWNNTIRETTALVHGEATPVVVATSGSRSPAAVLDANVVAAADALDGVTVSTALGTLSTVLDNMIDKFNAHRIETGVHSANDTDNAIDGAFKGAASEAGVVAAARELRKALDAHMRNDAGTGTGSGAYHEATGQVDWTNAMVAGAPATLAQAVSSLGDLWRAYEAHRVSTAVHNSADTTNTLTALPALHNVARRLSEYLAKLNPSAPPELNSGAVLLVHGAGAEES